MQLDRGNLRLAAAAALDPAPQRRAWADAEGALRLMPPPESARSLPSPRGSPGPVAIIWTSAAGGAASAPGSRLR